MSTDKLRYPIGVHVVKPFTPESKKEAIQTIAAFPKEVRKTCASLSEEELNRPYRPGGWTKRQVVHHCADSHMNAYIRFKWALTEDTPTIKAYNEKAWAEQPDYQSFIGPSMQLLDALHERWTLVLRNMTDDDFQRSYYHPERNAETNLGENLLHYQWHCKHHLAHIQS
ncbi:YfiT family bacillithiol transferase [Portibacter marinus]|uniref:YfiT family bacillithiol transferase n=1 Tax=Portibacter marinus TaxID=2898660 RepID=UPI001F324531|nr:putative metal-dependent hydrolase [Portibacter marinus]